MLALLFIGGRSSAQDIPFPFRRSDGLYGYVNTNHCWVIEPRFRFAGRFSEGLALVEIDDWRGFINLSGGLVFRRAEAIVGRTFSDGLVRIRSNDKWGFINRHGIMAINPQFEAAYDFSNGLAPVKLYGRWGFIDQSGRMVINPIFDEIILPFLDGLAVVQRNQRSEIIDQYGRTAIDIRFSSISPFSSDLASVNLGQGQGYAFINRSGNFAFSSRFEEARGFNEERAAVKINDRWGFIDRTGQIVIEPQFEDIYDFNEGFAAVRLNGMWGFIERSGRLVIQPQFTRIFGGFWQQRALVGFANYWNDYRTVFIDRAGRVLLDPTCNAPR
jgi:hypothetical protein